MVRRVIVTGVAGGLGRAIATRFHDDGWEVAGLDRREASADTPVDTFVKVDLLDADATIETIEDLADGGLDALVNNAAVQPVGSVTDAPVEQWQDTFGVNVRAPALAMRAAHGGLAQRRGAVVNVVSVHAVSTSPGRSAYVASKGALFALTRSAALEMAPDGIRVNAVLPGAIDTDMLHRGMEATGAVPEDVAESTPLGRVGEPFEIAEAVLFLADGGRSSFVTGHGLVVDGGVLAQLASE